MLNIKDSLLRLMSDIEKVQEQYHSLFQFCPPGELQSFVDRGRVQYLQVTHEGGKRKRHGINRNQKLLREMAHKEYLRSCINTLTDNIGLLHHCMDNYRELNIDSILKDLQAAYPGLSEEYFYDRANPTELQLPETDDAADDLKKRLDSHRQWESQPYEKSNYNPRGLRIRTSRGINVRTKSEALIVELLWRYGIPFHYEEVLHIHDGIIVPDFTFEMADGSKMYWEHAGMLTKPKYSFRHHLKMMQYESMGIYPWKNLIVTYDIDNEIDLEIIEAVIQKLLLPAL